MMSELLIGQVNIQRRQDLPPSRVRLQHHLQMGHAHKPTREPRPPA